MTATKHPVTKIGAANVVINKALCDFPFLCTAREAMASCSIEGNAAAANAGKTLDRILNGEKVSDAAMISLAQMLWPMMAEKEKNDAHIDG